LAIEVPRADAIRLQRQGKFEEAIEALRPHAAQPDASPRVLMAYGQALLGASRWSLAVWPLERAAKAGNSPPGASRFYVAALLNGGAEIEAIREATRLLDEDDALHRIRSLRSQGYEANLQLEEAVEDMEILVAELPENARHLERLLNLLVKIEDWDAARERIAQMWVLLEEGSVKPGARNQFCATASRFEHERGNSELAESQLRSCLESGDADANLVFSLVSLLDQLERIDEATTYLEGLAASYPRRPAIQEGLASRYSSLGRNDEAEATLRGAAERIGLTDGWLRLAEHHVAISELEEAAAAVDRAVLAATGKAADDPELDWGAMLAESRFGLAEVYLRAERYEIAERIIETLDDEPGFAKLLTARIKLDQGDATGALAEFQEAFRFFPSNPAARYLAARAAIEVGDFDRAVKFYQDSMRSDSTATDAGIVLARALVAQGDPLWAVDMLSFYMIKHPNDPLAIRLAARAGSAGGIPDWAKAVRDTLAKLPGWAGVALADQARDIAFTDGAAEAIEYLEASPSLDQPDYYEALSAWGRLVHGMGREKEARERALAVREAHPTSAGPWLSWSRILYLDGALSEAVDAARKASELNPLLAVAHAELGAMLIEQGDLDAALGALDQALVLEPHEPTPAVTIVDGLLAAERFEEAEKRLETLLVAHPWHAHAAWLLVERERAKHPGEPVDERYYQLARRAVRYKAASGPEAILTLAEIEFARGDFNAAAVAFQSTLRAQYDAANASFGLGRSLAELGRREEAIAAIEAALSMEGLDEPVLAVSLLETLRAEGES
jgi:tetratricopeptide (TPR) repeat protein